MIRDDSLLRTSIATVEAEGEEEVDGGGEVVHDDADVLHLEDGHADHGTGWRARGSEGNPGYYGREGLCTLWAGRRGTRFVNC